MMSAPDFYIKQNDRLPRIAATLKGGDNAAVNLTGATVKFLMRAPGSSSLKVDASATVTSAVAGQVEYAWASGDTDTVGRYEAEWEVTFSGGTKQTFPNDRHTQIEISDDIG